MKELNDKEQEKNTGSKYSTSQNYLVVKKKPTVVAKRERLCQKN